MQNSFYVTREHTHVKLNQRLLKRGILWSGRVQKTIYRSVNQAKTNHLAFITEHDCACN